MHRGYIKLWRKSIDGGWLRNHVLWAFWSWCLLKASHKPINVLVGYQQIHLDPGQLIFGRHRAAAEIAASPRQVRTCVDLLKKNGNIVTQATNKYTIITVVNWQSYQDSPQTNGQQFVTQATNKRPAGDHKQELKALKALKEKDPPDLQIENKSQTTRSNVVRPLPKPKLMQMARIAFKGFGKEGLEGFCAERGLDLNEVLADVEVFG